MDHHALAGRRVSLADAGAARGDHAARLVARDDGPAGAAEAERRGGVADGPIRMKIAPAHAGRLHGHHDLAGSGRRIGELTHFKLSATEKNYATHTVSLRLPTAPPRLVRLAA
jgi:hypothetical protein